VLISTNRHILFIDLNKGLEIDIDAQENIESIQQLKSDEDKFYVICNIKDGKQGMFLFSFDHNDT